MCESPSPSTRILACVPNEKNRIRRLAIASAIALAWSAILMLPAAAQQAGQNVNMVTAGTSWTNGDPFRERQNEPSMAVSTRNSSHIVAAANDYRTVDIPGVLGIDARGDAWIGLFKSFDGGLTWRSTLMPGYPLDSSPQGLASPLHGRQAAADPVVRAGTNGLFYVAGIAFDRGASPLSKVFVMRLADLNNKENGDAAAENGSPTNLAPRDTIKYVDTNVVDTGTSSRFLDKPWMAVDIPRAGHETCTVNANEDGTVVTQKVPAGAIYMTYTAFTTVGAVTNSQILFRRSMNCGVTWSKPIVLSSSDDSAGVQDSEGQGTVIAIDPSVPAGHPARIYVAWRVFAEPGDPDDPGRIMIAQSLDGGQSFDEPEPAVTFPLSCNTAPTGVGCPFDQPQTGTTFRSNGYPALTVDNYGRIYLAWSQRDVNGDGRIFLTSTYSVEFWPKSNFKEIDTGAIYDDSGNPFGNLYNRGSQLMPTLNFNSGKLILTYYDLRQDHTSGQLTPLPEPACDPTITPLCPLGNPFSEMRQFEGELLSNPGAVFNAYINDATLTVRRHTLDIIGSEASPNVNPLNLGLPNFTHFRVSRYQYGVIPPDTGVEQGQFNAPNLPMFVQGTAPFMGDYIDVAGTPSMVLDPVKGWIFNTSPAANPVFHSVWTDNRDVQPPPDGISWNKYTPPTSSNIGATSKFDPTQTPPACISGYSGMRDQNIYTSTISQGLILTSPQTEKPVLQTNGQPIQRQFVVIMRNESNLSRTFQVSIPAQPVSAQASFLQFSLSTSIPVAIPAFSTASRAVFLTPNPGSTVAFPQFQVNAAENDGANPPLSASILFNADPTNPFLASPDDASFGGSTISSQEFYNPAVLNPAALNPAALNPAVLNPAVLNPAALNPAVLNPAALNPSALNPNFVVALNPAALNATIENPAVLNNAVANPAVLNPAALNTPVSDANYTVTNEGNTSATYQLQLFQSGNLPAGSVFQIILTKTYLTPGVSPLDGCTFGGQVNNEVVASIDNPAFVTNPSQLGNPAALNGAINNTTYALAPGDTLQITLRANLTVDDLATLVLPNITPVVASQAVNTVDVQNGVTTPPITILVTTATVPVAVAAPGQPYSTTLAALGGNPPLSADTWQLIGGSLPPGLNLSTSGVISGTATAPGNYTFTVQVTDTGTPQHTAIRSLSMTVVAPVTITTPALPNATLNNPYAESFTASGGLLPITWSNTGTLPPGLTFTSAGLLSGTPTALGTFNFNVTATDSLGLFQTLPYSVTVTNVIVQTPATVTFVVQPSNTIGAQPISPAVQVQVLDVTGAAIANTQVAMNFGNAACPTATLSGSPLATTATNGIATFGNLLIDHGQNNFTLLATAGNAVATSNPFNIEGFCETAGMNTARHNHIVLGLPNGTVLVTGGAVNSDNTGALASAELYNTSTHTWTTLPNMSVARVDHTMTLLNNGKVLIAGGFNDSGITNTLEIFDPVTNTFTLLPATMSSPRAEHEATLLASGKVLLTGGNASQTITSNTADIFDPSAETVTLSTHTMSTVRQIHHADLLPNGLVLVTGGFDQNNAPLASAELYDPIADTFTLTGSMATARGNHGSALLYNGKVLVAGGVAPVNGAIAVTASAELYDPSTGTFSPTGSMSIPRAHYAPPTLTDGTVFFEGGATLPAGTNADIYNPATGTFRVTSNFTAVGAQTGMRDAIQSDGTVLLASGVNASTVAVPNSEVFYPLSLPTGITITTSTLPNATQDKPYTQFFQEFGGVGNLTWSLATGTLPPGITLSTSGLLMGTPTSAGTFTFAVSVQDSANPPKTENSSLLTLVVSGVPLQFTSNTVPGAGAGRFYSQALPIIGGTFPYTVTQTGGTLPPGLTLSSAGVLEGTPSAAGSFTFTVQAVDSSTTTQTANQTFTISVDTLFITTTVLPDGVAGVAYNAPISTAGGTLPLTFSPATTAFPPGLTIQEPGAGSHNGALAGTPTQAGTFTFTESVTDSSNPTQTATQIYTVVIAPAGRAAPANVTFVNQPQTSVGGQTISGGPVIVSVTDANNNPISGASIALSLGALFGQPVPCSDAVLSGTLSALTGANGQATFSNLSIDRGGFSFALIASAGSASGTSTPFNVQGFCPAGNLSTQRELHTQIQLGTPQSIVKFPLDPKGTYLFTNTNPPPPGTPDIPDAPLIIPLASLGLAPGSVISGVPVGDLNPCGFAGESCFGEVFQPFTCGVFSSSNTLLPSGGTINRVPGAIAPNFNTAFPCNTGSTVFGSLPTDIPQDFAFFGEPVTVPPGAAYLFVAFVDTLYADNVDPNGDYGIQLTINSPITNGKVLIAGGVDNNGNALNTAELFDPASGTTFLTGNLTDPNGRTNQVSILLPNGQVLLAGGFDNASANALTSAELYNPATGTFTPTGSMTYPRSLAEAVLLADGRVLVAGGNNTNVGTNTAEIYDPSTGLWTPTGNMTQARIRHTMTLLPNGKVLVAGGRDAALDFFGLSSAELFDPYANQGVGAFTSIGNMNSVRFVHTATLLPNGTVLIAGGFNAGNTSLAVASAEIFDPSTNTFTPTSSMSIPRSRNTSTVLPDGTVLEVGGTNSIQGVTAPAPAEIYSATTGSFTQTGTTTIGRELHRASPLFNGNVLVSGGDDGVNVLSTTEVYYNPVVKEPIQITTASIPNAIVGQPYVALALEENSAGPVTWSVISGAFPPGIKGSTIGTYGVASGIPTTAGSYTFTAQVTDGISTATQSYTINVSVATLAFTSNTMPLGGVEKTYSQPLPVTGGTPPYTATLTGGGLPAGLSLSTTGVISGTPSQAGTFTFTVNVTDSATATQSATQTLTMVVNSLSITTTALPGGTVGVPYNTAITTDGGTLPLTFSPAAAAFPPGLAIQQPAANSASGALNGTPTLPGHYTFTETVTDSSAPTQTATQSYTMDILPAGATTVPALLTFLTQPQNSVGGQVLTGSPIRVRVTDASNALVVGASVAMSFNGALTCSTAVLSGTLTALSNGNGIAVFPDLSIDRGQLAYTLLASTGNVSAESQSFTVNGFCPTGNMSAARELHTEVLLPNSKVLIAGGANDSQTLSTAELYDPVTGTVSATGNLTAPNGRAWQSSVLLQNGQELVIGGVDSAANPLATAELYNPGSGTFTATGTMAQARSRAAAVLLADGRVLVSGGIGVSGDLSSSEIYDPATGLFTLTGSLNVARARHTATLLPNGKVLVAGGNTFSGQSTALASAELFDPNANSGVGAFSLVGSMNSPRDEARAVLLSNGTVLVVGGFASYQTNLASSTADIFNPATNSFTLSSNSMSVARAHPTATLLADGTILVAGGVPDTGATTPATASADIFNPATGSFTPTGAMDAQREYARDALLGYPLISGGDDGINTTSSEEIYYSTAPTAPLAITPAALPSGTTGQPYTQMLLEQGAVGTMTWTLASGTLPPGISVRNDGFLIGTPTSSGTFTFTVHLVDSSTPQKSATSGNFTLVINPGASPLNFSAQTLNTGITGVVYSTPALTVTGGTTPYTFAVTGGTLPPGVTLSSAGVFGGTPTATGTFSFTVTVTDSSLPSQVASQAFAIPVVNALTISTTTLPSGSVGTPYTTTISTIGGTPSVTFAVAAGTFPPGLSLAPNGTITGTPTTLGTFTFTLMATDQSVPPQTSLQSYTITVAALSTIGNIRIAQVAYTDSGTPLTVTWNPPFADTNYTAVCTAETQPSDFLLPTITSRSPGSMTVSPTDGGSPAGTLNCMAVPDSDSSDVRRARVAYSGFPASVVMTWNTAFPDLNYTPVCIAETEGPFGGGFTSAISAESTNGVTVLNNGFDSGTMHCIAVPDSDTLGFRHARVAFTSPQTSPFLLTWNAPFANANYVAVCFQQELGIGSTDFADAIQAGSRAAASIGVLTGIPAGSVGCFAAAAAPRYAYVPISNGNVVQVFSASSYQPVTTIPVGAAPFDAVVSPDGSLVYVDNSNDNSVSVVNPATNTVVATIPVGSIPAGMAITPDGSTLYVATHGDNSVSVVNTVTRTLTTTIPVGSYPFLLAMTPDGKHVYVPNFQSNSVSVISTATNTVVATVPVGQAPQSVAVTPDSKSAYVTCTNSNLVYVLNTATNAVVTTIPISNGPLAVSITPDGTKAYVSEYNGAATAVINLATNTVVGTVPVGITPYGSAITPDGAFVWQASWDAANVSVISTATNTVVATIPVSGFDFNVALTNGFTVNTNPIVFAAQTLPTAITGSAYSTSLTGASGGTPPYSIAITGGTQPPGISLASNGAFTGTATTAGNFPFTVTATDSSSPPQVASQSFTIVVVNPLTITTASLPNGTVGTPYTAAISSSGGLQPASFAVTSGTLPTGLTLAGNGALTGTPTVANIFTFTVTATDGSTPAQTFSQSYTVTIAPAVIPPASVTFTNGPAASTGGQLLQPGPLTVSVLDSGSNPLPNVAVTMAFNGAPPCSNAVLGGTLTQTTNASGVATFPDLTIDRGQFAYSLAATAGAITAISTPFNVEGFCNTSMPSAARFGATATLLQNGQVLITGGVDAGSLTSVVATAELYNSFTRTFTPTGSMNAARVYHTATLLNDGTVLITGGSGTTINGNNFQLGPALNSAELYNPSTGVFTLLASTLSSPRALHASVALLDGTVLVAGGSTGGAGATNLSTADLYNPLNQTFTASATGMTVARNALTATVLTNGNVLLAGGYNAAGAANQSAEIYDFLAQTFTATPANMAFAHGQHTSALLANGQVGLFGGDDATLTPSSNIEDFDPTVNTFTASTVTLASPRSAHSSLVLPDGRVLTAAGFDNNGNILNSAETFNFSTPSSSLTGSMQVPRWYTTETALPDGTVLVAGGGFSSGTLTNLPAEVFYPGVAVPIAFFTLLPNANENQPYTDLLLQAGGVGTLTWALTSTSAPLPTGLTLASNGVLSGTPTVFGTFSFTATVTDSSTPPRTGTNTYVLVINPAFQLFSQMTTAFSGIAYSATLPILGGTAPFTSQLVGGTLPTGLNLTGSTNTVAGTTSALGSYPLTFQVTDSSNPTQIITQTTTLAVITPLAITTTTLPNGALNSSYSAVVNTTGGLAPVVVAPTSAMPPGLTMNVLGVISGTPTQTGTFTFTVDAVDTAYPPEIIPATLSITVNASVSPIQLSPNPLNLLANNTGTMTATLSSPAGSGGVLVTLNSSSAAASVPASVTVPAAQSSIGFQVTAGPTAGTATITASATGDTSGNASVVVTTRPMALTTDGPLLAINRSFNATVTLAQPVPAGAILTVTLTSGTAGVVSISPATQNISGGGTTAVFTLTAGATSGSTILTASAPGYTNATSTLTVTSNQISFGTIPTLAPGQTASLPVSLSFAAPPGGLTVNFSSANPAIATITPSVFVPAGLLIPAANPQVTGVAIGSTSFNATAVGFAPDTGAVTVTVTAGVSPNPASFAATRTQVETITISAAAPAGGITFNLVSDTPSVATVPATATIPVGQLTTSFTINGIAQGTANINVTSSGIASNIVPVTVNAPPSISIGAVIIGNNMIGAVGTNLTVAPLVNQLMTLTSNDPTHFLLTNDPTKVGTASITVQLTAGTTSVPNFYVEGQNYSGVIDITSTITATAAGYTSANPALNLYPSGLTYLFTSALSTTTFSSPTVLTVYFAILSPGTLTFYNYGFNLGPQAPAPVPVNITSTTPSVGTITSGGSATIPIGSYYTQALSFQPGTAGTTNLNLATPSGYSTTANYPVQIVATVSAPAISVNSTTVGNNLITSLGVSLGAAPQTAETLTITSPDPTHFLLTTDPTKVGTASISLPLTAGSSSVPTFYVEGQNYSGTTAITTTLTASAPGYAASTGGVTNLYPSGLTYLFTSTLNTTTFSSPTPLTVYLSILNPGTLSFYNYGYNLGPQASPVSVSIADSVSATGTLTGNPTSIPVGSYYTQAISFQPVAAGTTNLTITTPAGYSTPSNYPVLILATVTAPVITLSNLVVGNNMIIGVGGSLGAAPPTSETLTITSPDPTHFLLTTDPTKVGTASINLPLTAGSASLPTFYVEGQNFSGSTAITANLSASAPGYSFSSGTGVMSLYPSGVTYLFTSAISTTTFSQPTTLTVYFAILSPGTLNFYNYGYLLGPQAPGAIPISVSDTNPSVGSLTGNPSSIPVGSYFTQGIVFHPATAGTTNLNLANPSGYSIPANYPVQIVATVTAPTISISNPIVGNGLVTQGSLSLAAAPPSNETLTITSTDPTHFLLTADPTKVGTTSISLQLTGGSTTVPTFYIEGQNFSGPIAISATLTASAAGFSDGNATMSLYPSGLAFFNGSTLTTTAASPPTALSVYVVVLNPGTLNVYTYGYNVGPQVGAIPVTITSTNTSVGTISGSSGAITTGNYSTEAISFVPVASGTTNLNLATPTGYFTPTNYPVQIMATVQ